MEQTAAMSNGNGGLWPRQIGPTSAWWLHRTVVDAVVATLEEEGSEGTNRLAYSLLMTLEMLYTCVTGEPISDFNLDGNHQSEQTRGSS